MEKTSAELAAEIQEMQAADTTTATTNDNYTDDYQEEALEADSDTEQESESAPEVDGADNKEGDMEKEEEVDYLLPKAEGQEDAAKEEEDDGDGLSADDAKVVGKFVDKRIAHLEEELKQSRMERKGAEFKSFMAGEGALFKPFEEKIRGIYSSDVFAKMPIKEEMRLQAAVTLAVGWRNLLLLGAKRERTARDQSRASETGGSGGQRRGGMGGNSAPDFNGIASSDMNAMIDAVKSGKKVDLR